MLARMAALGAQYPRFGYRRIRIFLGREGHAMSWGRAYRLWRRAKLAGAPPTSAQAHRQRTAKAAGADRRQPGVVLRLRLRLVRERPAAQVPDCHRRVDQEGGGDRGRWLHPLGSRHRGAFAAYQRARGAALFAFGQWAGVRRPGATEVGSSTRASRPL